MTKKKEEVPVWFVTFEEVSNPIKRFLFGKYYYALEYKGSLLKQGNLSGGYARNIDEIKRKAMLKKRKYVYRTNRERFPL